MRASRSVGRRVALGLRELATKTGKGDAKVGQVANNKAAAKPAAPAAPAAPAPPAAPPAAAAAASTPKPPVTSTTPPPKPPTTLSTPPPKSPAAAGGAAAAAGAGGGGAATAEGGAWIIHPSVPVDARLLGAGLAGAGLLAYSLMGGEKEGEEAPAPAAVEEEVVVVTEEPEPALAQEQEGAPLADTAPQHVDEGFQQQQQQQQAAAEPEAAAAAAAEEEAAPTYVDGSKVLSVIEEVLTLDAISLLQQAAAQPAAAASEPAPAGAGADQEQPQVMPGAEGPGAGSKDESAGGGGGAKGGKARGKGWARGKGKRVVVEEQEELLDALQAGLADSTADLLASEVGKAALKGPKPTPAPEPEPLPPLPALPELGPQVAHASSVLAGVDPIVKEILGIQQDVTPAGLIQAATQHGQGAGEDWVQYRHRHRQAVADAQFIAALLEAAAKNVKGTLESKDQAIVERDQALEATREGLRKQGEEFRKLLQAALEDADKQAKTALKLQAQNLAVAHAEMTVRERKERLAKMDEVRTQLNALEEAFKRRSDERRASTGAHQLAVGAFALQSALEAGQPLKGAVSYLGGACKDDPLVASALATIPAAAEERGVWTRTQIADGFADVQRLARQLSWVPEGQGGLLTITLAKLASKLKIAERGPQAAAVKGDCIDRDLAVVQLELVDGKLLKAAEDLERAVQGTAAAAEVANWVQQVRLRVLAEQTAALLQAHASALTASLA